MIYLVYIYIYKAVANYTLIDRRTKRPKKRKTKTANKQICSGDTLCISIESQLSILHIIRRMVLTLSSIPQCKWCEYDGFHVWLQCHQIAELIWDRFSVMKIYHEFSFFFCVDSSPLSKSSFKLMKIIPFVFSVFFGLLFDSKWRNEYNQPSFLSFSNVQKLLSIVLLPLPLLFPAWVQFNKTLWNQFGLLF